MREERKWKIYKKPVFFSFTGFFPIFYMRIGRVHAKQAIRTF